MLDQEELAILQAADRNESVLRPAGDSAQAARDFDRICEKVLVLGRRGLLKLYLNATSPAKPGSKGKYAEVQIGRLSAAGARELAKHTPPSEAAVSAARRVIRAAIKARDSEFKHLAASRAESGSIGSAFVVVLRRITQDELHRRGDLVLSTWSQLLSSQGKVTSDSVLDLIRYDLRDALDAADALWAPYFSPGRMGTKPTKDDFEGLAEPIREEFEAALDMAASIGSLGTSTSPSTATAPVSNDNSITIHGSVTGPVMSGHGSTASMTVGTDAETFARLVVALVEARDLVMASGSSEPQRYEVIGALDAAVAEAQKPTPNRLSLSALLAAAGGGIQTLGAVPGAYTVLKGAGALVGIHLP